MLTTDYLKELAEIMSAVEVTDSDRSALSIDEGGRRATGVLLGAKATEHKAMIIGNGGSAAIAGHMQIDLVNAVGMQALVFNEPSMLTAFGNDYGYPAVFERPIATWCQSRDVLIAISSSGQSENILRAVRAALLKRCHVITLSGFEPDNPLRSMGHLNFFVPSFEYGFVELAHSILTHNFTDMAKAAQALPREPWKTPQSTELSFAPIVQIPASSRFGKTPWTNAPSSRAAAFLDRDGVIIKDTHFVKSPGQVTLLDGAAAAIRALASDHYIIVVTNQSGIARGHFGEQDLIDINNEMFRQLNAQGAFVDAVYACPHHPEADVEKYKVACSCRKPEPGLILRAAEDHSLDLGRSFIVGDTPRDVEAGISAGIPGILVGKKHREHALSNWIGWADNLLESLEVVPKYNGRTTSVEIPRHAKVM